MKRITKRDEFGNADIDGMDMSFVLGLKFDDMVRLTNALNRLADYEDTERPKAKWIHFDETKRFHEAWQCSNCYHDVIENPRYTNRVTGESLDFRFCPFCGAVMSDMREVKKREID